MRIYILFALLFSAAGHAFGAEEAKLFSIDPVTAKEDRVAETVVPNRVYVIRKSATQISPLFRLFFSKGKGPDYQALFSVKPFPDADAFLQRAESEKDLLAGASKDQLEMLPFNLSPYTVLGGEFFGLDAARSFELVLEDENEKRYPAKVLHVPIDRREELVGKGSSTIGYRWREVAGATAAKNVIRAFDLGSGGYVAWKYDSQGHWTTLPLLVENPGELGKPYTEERLLENRVYNIYISAKKIWSASIAIVQPSKTTASLWAIRIQSALTGDFFGLSRDKAFRLEKLGNKSAATWKSIAKLDRPILFANQDQQLKTFAFEKANWIEQARPPQLPSLSYVGPIQLTPEYVEVPYRGKWEKVVDGFWWYHAPVGRGEDRFYFGTKPPVERE